MYEDISDLKARSLVKEHLIARNTSLANITDAEGQWRLLILKPIEELNTNPLIINVRNGLYNVLANTLAPHTPEYYSTCQINVNFEPDAACPRFKQFLEESLNPDDIPLIQEMLGYFLVPVSKAQKSFVIVGEAGAGKINAPVGAKRAVTWRKKRQQRPVATLERAIQNGRVGGQAG